MLIIIAAGASVAPAAAASAHEQTPIIVTGQRTAAPAQEETGQRPGGTDLVEAEEYENRLAVSLREALAFSPGVQVQPRFGQEVRLSIRGSGIGRGFHMRGIMLLQDGVPINLADDNGDFQELDPTVFEHIQVFRGASGLRFGGSTLGGAINGVTPNGRSAAGLRLRLDGGSFQTLRALAAFGYGDERGDAWAAMTTDRSDGERQHARRNSVRFHANAGLNLSRHVQTRFYASVNDIDQELPGGLLLATVKTNPRIGNFAGDQRRDVDSLRLQNRTSISLGAVSLELGLFLNTKALFHPIFQVIEQKSSDRGLLARLSWQSGAFDLSLGTTARFGSVDARRYLNVNGRRGSRTFQAEQRARTIDLYGEGRYRLGQFSLIAGGIYTQGKRRQDQVFPAPAQGKADYDEFSPRFGFLWEPREAVQVYGNYSRSHELPGFTELAQITSFVPLGPQRAWTAELGIRGIAGPARFDLSLYRAQVRAELLQFTIGPDIPASTFNAGRSLHQGVEAGLDLELFPWARLRQVYQFSDFRFKDDRQYGDNRLPVVPRHLYRAELRLGSGRINVAPMLEWVPQGAWADYANSLRVGGYATISATAEAELRSGLSLFVDARNLAARKEVGDITAVVDYGTLASFQRAIFYPIERRSVFGGIRASF